MHQHCRRIIRQCEEMIATVEYWNRNRTDCEPLDCETERVILSVARACLVAIDADDLPEVQRLSDKLLDIANGSAGVE
jgi:glucose dehydrogenase